MIKKQILYFYEYASENRDSCVGHAKLINDADTIHISLAFSLPKWKKTECPVYIMLEDFSGNIEIIALGSLYPKDVLTVYDFKLHLRQILRVKPEEIENLGISVIENLAETGSCSVGNRYIKAVSGVMNITLENLLSMTDTASKSKLKPDRTGDIGLSCELEKNAGNTEHKHYMAGEGSQNKISEFPYRKMMEMRVEYNPFTTGKITNAVKISVADILLLSEKDPGLRDNSFLMHSFYKYKHILLAVGSIFGRKCYYILAPGLKTGKEQRMADMYGFHNFISLDGQPAGVGAFGYYSWLL